MGCNFSMLGQHIFALDPGNLHNHKEAVQHFCVNLVNLNLNFCNNNGKIIIVIVICGYMYYTYPVRSSV